MRERERERKEKGETNKKAEREIEKERHAKRDGQDRWLEGRSGKSNSFYSRNSKVNE